MMDYEKKYNEALERAKAYHRNELAGSRKEMTEYIFPELRESEDEGIRRKMIEHFKSKTKETWCNMPVKDILAWLEKQKEQKPTIWTEEDEKNLCELLAYGETRLGLRRWIAGLPEKIKGLQQKPAEWSDEDKVKIHFLSRLIEFQVKDGEYCFGGNGTVSKQEAIEMLKSLRPSWKPNEEQMEALMLAIEGKCLPTSYMSRRLEDLYEQLKKL